MLQVETHLISWGHLFFCVENWLNRIPDTRQYFHKFILLDGKETKHSCMWPTWSRVSPTQVCAVVEGPMLASPLAGSACGSLFQETRGPGRASLFWFFSLEHQAPNLSCVGPGCFRQSPGTCGQCAAWSGPLQRLLSAAFWDPGSGMVSQLTLAVYKFTLI